MRHYPIHIILFCILPLLCVSCAGRQAKHHQPRYNHYTPAPATDDGPQPAIGAPAQDTGRIEHHALPFDTMEGPGSTSLSADTDGEVLSPRPLTDQETEAHAPSKAPPSRQDVQVAVENMELNRFIHLVFGQYLKTNYFVDKQTEKKTDPVTLYMDRPVPLSQFRRLVREVLATYNIEVRSRNGMTFIGPVQKRSRKKEPVAGVFVGRHLPEDLDDSLQILALLPLDYLNARKTLQIINGLHPLRDGVMMPLAGNVLAIRGRAGDIRDILGMVQILDRPTLGDKHLSLLKLNFLEPDRFIERLREILAASGIPVAADKNGHGLRLISLPELSSVLLVSPKTAWISLATKWADTLDTPKVLGPEPKIFIYRPKNRKAQELAAIISGLFASSDRRSTQLPARRSGAGPASGQAAKEGGKKNQPAGTTGNRSGKTLRSGEMSITVDDTRNTLVIFASPIKYEKILRNLRELDSTVRQVMLEVMIAEVTLTDKLQYGVEWYLRHQGASSNLTISTLGRLGIGDNGVLAVFSKNSGDFLAMLNLFAKNDQINILASPRLVVLDNETANFSVGTDVPVVTSENSAPDINNTAPENGPSIMRNIEYRKTGISVAVTPTIYSRGVLRLDISANLSEAQKNDVSPSIDSPLILDRTLETNVILENGMFILLGGLISESTSQGDSGIPLLKDIPLVGDLFKTSSTQTTRTELIIQVRPVILESFQDANRETVDFRNLLRGLDL